jgi:tetratricopeptide (TPR) repeat protein
MKKIFVFFVLLISGIPAWAQTPLSPAISESVIADYRRGMTHLEKGNYEAANKDFTVVIQVQQTRPDSFYTIYVKRGITYFHLGNYDAAIQDYNTALLHIHSPETIYLRGVAYGRKNEYDAAIKDLSQIINDPLLKNNDSKLVALAYLYRGEVYFELEQYDLADADFTQAIYINPNDSDAYFGKYLICLTKLDFANALLNIEQALKIEPTNDLYREAFQETNELLE